MGGDREKTEMVHGVPAALWQSLFRKFSSIVRMRPWDWLGRHDFFGVRAEEGADPVFLHFQESDSSAEPGLTMVFGWKGEGLYRGVLLGIDHVPMRSYEIPLVRAYLRPVGEMTPVEREILEASGLEPDDKGRAPVFVRYRPGWMPWILDPDDAALCETVLNQALGILLRAETDKTIVSRSDPATVWVRSFGGGAWTEGWEDVRPFEDHAPGLKSMPPDSLVEKVAALPESIPSVEVGLDIVPKVALVNEEIVKKCAGGRMPLGYFFAVADASSDEGVRCLESGVLYPCDDIAGMWDVLPRTLLDAFVSIGRRPREIAVSSHLMMAFLRPLQTRIHFKLTFHEKLPRFDAFLAEARALIDDTLAKASNEHAQ